MSWLFKMTSAAGITVALSSLVPHVGQAQELAEEMSPRVFVDRYCVTCHNKVLKTGG